MLTIFIGRTIVRKKRIFILLFAFALLTVVHGYAASDIRYVYTENGGRLNMRDQPSTIGSIIEQVPSGTRVTILQEDENWSKISSGEKTGYVMSRYLATSKKKDTGEKWQSVSRSMYVNTRDKKSLHLREEASRASRSLALIKNGSMVNVTAVSASWARVNVDGKDGYMMLSFLSSEAPEENTKTREMYIKCSKRMNVYREPDTKSEVLLSVPSGTKVRTYRDQGKWLQIVVQGTMGYVPASSLAAEKPENKNAETAIVINPNGASYVNLRNKPGIKSENTILAHIRVNTSVSVIGRIGTWRKILYDGMVGYVHRDFLQYKKEDSAQ